MQRSVRRALFLCVQAPRPPASPRAPEFAQLTASELGGPSRFPQPSATLLRSPAFLRAPLSSPRGLTAGAPAADTSKRAFSDCPDRPAAKPVFSRQSSNRENKES